MPSYKLHYFDVRGRAELIRLILHQAGVEFEDARYTFEEWKEVKDNEKIFPLGKMPVLQIDEETSLPQSFAIARYLANEYELSGKSNLEKAQCDSILYTIQDLFDHFYNWIYMVRDEDVEEQNKKEFFDTILPQGLKQIEKLLRMSNEGKGYFLGENVTMVDLYIIVLADMWGEERFDSVPLVKDLLKRVKELPNIKKYLESRPATKF